MSVIDAGPRVIADMPEAPQIPGIEVRHCPRDPGLSVGSDGSVYSCKNARWGFRPMWRELKPRPDGWGYLQIAVRAPNRRGQTLKRVHVLVLEAFVGPRPDGAYGCHNDGNPKNNCATNLRWDTPSSNALDAIRHGTAKRRLSAIIVLEIRSLRGKTKQADIARQFGITQAMVSAVQHRRCYAYVEDLP